MGTPGGVASYMQTAAAMAVDRLVTLTSKHFICPMFNITIHFHIKDRAGCLVAKRAINAGCLHQ